MMQNGQWVSYDARESILQLNMCNTVRNMIEVQVLVVLCIVSGFADETPSQVEALASRDTSIPRRVPRIVNDRDEGIEKENGMTSERFTRVERPLIMERTRHRAVLNPCPSYNTYLVEKKLCIPIYRKALIRTKSVQRWAPMKPLPVVPLKPLPKLPLFKMPTRSAVTTFHSTRKLPVFPPVKQLPPKYQTPILPSKSNTPVYPKYNLPHMPVLKTPTFSQPARTPANAPISQHGTSFAHGPWSYPGQVTSTMFLPSFSYHRNLNQSPMRFSNARSTTNGAFSYYDIPQSPTLTYQNQVYQDASSGSISQENIYATNMSFVILNCGSGISDTRCVSQDVPTIKQQPMVASGLREQVKSDNLESVSESLLSEEFIEQLNNNQNESAILYIVNSDEAGESVSDVSHLGTPPSGNIADNGILVFFPNDNGLWNSNSLTDLPRLTTANDSNSSLIVKMPN